MSASGKRRRAGGSKPGSIGEPSSPPYVDSKSVARVFQSGNSQAIRLPKEFRLNASEVQIFRRGNDIVIRERPASLRERLAALPPLPLDAFPDEIPDYLPEPVEKF
jgi:antitoxin VapB